MRDDRFLLSGGLDLATPSIAVKPGKAIACLNYEPQIDGYARIKGYERFDGRPSPSDAVYYTLELLPLPIDQDITALTAGTVVVDNLGNIVGTLLGDVITTPKDAKTISAMLVITADKIILELEYGDDLKISGSDVTFGKAAGPLKKHGMVDASAHSQWQDAAVQRARDAIAKTPPGSGPVRGVFDFKGTTYCIRDVDDRSKSVVYSSSPRGWEAIPEYWELPFRNGLAALGDVNPGDLITSNNGTQARVLRVIVESGSFSNNDATGRLILDDLVNNNEANHIYGAPEPDRDIPVAANHPNNFGLVSSGNIMWDGSQRVGFLTAYNLWTKQREPGRDIKLGTGFNCRGSALMDGDIIALLEKDGLFYIRQYSTDGILIKSKLINQLPGSRYRAIAYDGAHVWVGRNNMVITFYKPLFDPDHHFFTNNDFMSFWAPNYLPLLKPRHLWFLRNSSVTLLKIDSNTNSMLQQITLTDKTSAAGYMRNNSSGIWSDGKTIWLSNLQHKTIPNKYIIKAFRLSALFGDGILVRKSNTPLFTTNGIERQIELHSNAEKYSFDYASFKGNKDSQRVYAANGEQRAFEFGHPHYESEKPPLLCPINSPMDDDRPVVIAEHKQHLFLGFDNGRIIHSSIGDPMKYTTITGAVELGLSSPVTGFVRTVGDVLAIFSDSNIHALHGSSGADWNLKTISDFSGAKKFTAQSGKTPIYCDNWGLRSVVSTDAFGEFSISDISTMIEPIMKLKADNGLQPVGSQWLSSENKYRMFWPDGTGLSVFLGGKYPSIMLLDLGVRVFGVFTFYDVQQQSIRQFVGTEDGRVLELDRGSSFDGKAIKSFLRLPFTDSRLSYQNKRYHKIGVNIKNKEAVSLGISAEFNHSESEPQTTQEQAVSGSGGFWDDSFWDAFSWSAPVIGEASSHVDGFGTNVSMAFASESIGKSFTLTNAYIYYSLRGRKK